MPSRKVVYAQEAQNITTTLVQIIVRAIDAREAYFDRGYEVGGSNPITSEDIVLLDDVEPVDIAALMPLIDQMEAFVDTNSVILNKLRTDL
jgi:hypothetical protein